MQHKRMRRVCYAQHHRGPFPVLPCLGAPSTLRCQTGGVFAGSRCRSPHHTVAPAHLSLPRMGSASSSSMPVLLLADGVGDSHVCAGGQEGDPALSLSVMNHGHSRCSPVPTWPAALGVTSITQGSWEAGSNPAFFGPLPTAARTCRKMGPGQGLPGCLAGLAGSWAQKGLSSGAALFLLLLAGPLGHYLYHLCAGGCSSMTGMGWGPR